MTRLSSLPREILQHILIQVDPTDLAAICEVSRDLHSFVHGNRALFKTLFLQRLDNPPRNTDLVTPEQWDKYKNEPCQPHYPAPLDSVEPDWNKELRQLIQLMYIMKSNVEKRKRHLTDVARIVAHLLRIGSSGYESSKTIAFVMNLFKSKQNREIFFQKSTIFDRIRGEYTHFLQPDEEQQALLEVRNASAKLHCLYGVPIESTGRTRSKKTYPFACSKVYDIRNYTTETKWGPFLGDGSYRVDWEMMEAVMVIVGHNMHNSGHERASEFCRKMWLKPFDGVMPDTYRPKIVDVDEDSKSNWSMDVSITSQDPYNVTGTWVRVVCFLDYTEFFAYNFASPRPADGTPRSEIETQEATRYIIMELVVTKIEAPGEDDGQELPVVHFKGTSRSMNQTWDANANSNLVGTVRLTKEGEVRWTTVSVYFGEERWRSEGVQVGGLRSARGVLGNWFDKDYDAHGPVGPSAFWKVSDELLRHPSDIEEITIAETESTVYFSDDDEPYEESVYAINESEEDDDEEEDGLYELEDGSITATTVRNLLRAIARGEVEIEELGAEIFD